MTTSSRPEDGSRTTIPLADVTAGHLRIRPGLDGARITTDAGLGRDLLHGSWKRAPKVTAESGHVTLTYPRRRARWGSDAITLNPTVPWDISIQGGVRRLQADLRGLKLRSFTIEGGASRLVLVLGKPDDDVQIDLEAADRVTIRRPRETQVRVGIAKGASQVAVDDQTYGAIGGETVLTTGPVVRKAYYVNVVGARRLRVTWFE